MRKLFETIKVKLFTGVVMSRVFVRLGKVATAAAVGLIAAPKVAPYIEILRPILTDMGTTPEIAATVGVASVLAALEKYLKQRLTAV